MTGVKVNEFKPKDLAYYQVYVRDEVHWVLCEVQDVNVLRKDHCLVIRLATDEHIPLDEEHDDAMDLVPTGSLYPARVQ